MNKVKLTIKDETGRCILKVGTSTEEKESYTNEEMIEILESLKESFK